MRTGKHAHFLLSHGMTLEARREYDRRTGNIAEADTWPCRAMNDMSRALSQAQSNCYSPAIKGLNDVAEGHAGPWRPWA